MRRLLTLFCLVFPAALPAFGQEDLTPDTELLSEIFAARYLLAGGHCTLHDAGLFNALAAATIEVSPMNGSDAPVLAGFAGMTPNDLRSPSEDFLMFAAASLAEEPPQASDWVRSLSGSVASWGMSSIRMPPGRGSDPCRLCSYLRWWRDAGARHRRAL
jgi:hypothetical protein